MVVRDISIKTVRKLSLYIRHSLIFNCQESTLVKHESISHYILFQISSQSVSAEHTMIVDGVWSGQKSPWANHSSITHLYAQLLQKAYYFSRGSNQFCSMHLFSINKYHKVYLMLQLPEENWKTDKAKRKAILKKKTK